MSRFHVILVKNRAVTIPCKWAYREAQGFAKPRLRIRAPYLLTGVNEDTARGFVWGWNSAR